MANDDDNLAKELSGDENIYEDKGIEQLLEEDAITETEAGIMKGIVHDDKVVKCSMCKKTIEDPNYAYELEWNDELYMFDSEECRDKFKQKHGIKDDQPDEE